MDHYRLNDEQTQRDQKIQVTRHLARPVPNVMIVESCDDLGIRLRMDPFRMSESRLTLVWDSQFSTEPANEDTLTVPSYCPILLSCTAVLSYQ